MPTTSPAKQKPKPAIPKLSEQSAEHVDTTAAALYLGRRPQTLRIWACKKNGPLKPVNIHGRLLWSVADIRKLVAPAA